MIKGKSRPPDRTSSTCFVGLVALPTWGDDMHIIDIVINTRLPLLRRRISFIVKFIDHSNISYFLLFKYHLLFYYLNYWVLWFFYNWFICKWLAPKYILYQILISSWNVTEIEVTRYFLVSKNILHSIAVDNNQLDLNEPHSKQGLLVYNNFLTVVCFCIYNMSLHLVSEFCYEFDGV